MFDNVRRPISGTVASRRVAAFRVRKRKPVTSRVRFAAAVAVLGGSLSCDSKPAVRRVDTMEVRDSLEAVTICRKAMPEQDFTLADVRNLGGGHYTLTREDLNRSRPVVAVCRTFLGELDTVYFGLIPHDRLKTHFERDRDEALVICRRAMPEQDLQIEDVHDAGGGNFTARHAGAGTQRYPRRVCKTRSGKLDTTYIETTQP